jgi:hypothetical protein
MQKKGLSKNRGIGSSQAFGLIFASLLLMAPCDLHTASNERMMTFSGQEISSIFDGLKPSRFALDFIPKRDKPRNVSRLWEEKMSDVHLGAHYLKACNLCQPGACFGSFERATPCYGCCTDPTGCPGLNNYTTDSKNYDQDDKVQDEPCGAHCCDDFANCAD